MKNALNRNASAAKITLVIAVIMGICSANPTLTPGTWVNLTPQDGGSYWCNDVQYAPSNHNILFACMTGPGPSKSTDGGATWASIHGNSTINSPQRIRIDPNNINHLYTICGVGGNQGFYYTTDGGANWTAPAGFSSVWSTVGTGDLYYISVDPTDFNHILLSYHYYWNSAYGGVSGVVESFDGGVTFTIHSPGGWGGTGHNIFFLYDPAKSIGNNRTWLLCVQDGGGFWRTTDAGTTWTKVYNGGMTHGGTSIYYASTGLLYAAAATTLIRSSDNGATWQNITNGVPYAWYFAMASDGSQLYTCPNNGPMIVSAETDGMTWRPLSTQTFPANSTMMTLDADNRIMYSAQREAGVWALKLPSTNTIAPAQSTPVKSAVLKKSTISFSRAGISILSAGTKIFDVKGRNIKSR